MKLSPSLGRSTNVATPGMWILKTGSLDIEGEFESPKVEYSRGELHPISIIHFQILSQKYFQKISGSKIAIKI